MSETQRVRRRFELWKITVRKAKELVRAPTPEDLFQRIERLPFKADAPNLDPEEVREMTDENDIWVVDAGRGSKGNFTGIFGKGRSVDIPAVRKGKKLRSIRMSIEEYLENPCHFILYENGFVIFARNPKGPRPSTLGAYLKNRCSELVSNVTVRRVVVEDFLKKLKRADLIRKVTMRFATDGLKKARREMDNDLMTALESALAELGCETVLVEFSMAHKRGLFNLQWKKKLEDFLEVPGHDESFLRLDINARMTESGEVELIKLFGLPAKREVIFKIPSGQKELDSDTVFKEIEKSYRFFKERMEIDFDE